MEKHLKLLYKLIRHMADITGIILVMVAVLFATRFWQADKQPRQPQESSYLLKPQQEDEGFLK